MVKPIPVSQYTRQPQTKGHDQYQPKTRFKAIAPNITTSADGQGNSPPEMPSASRLRQVTGAPSARAHRGYANCQIHDGDRVCHAHPYSYLHGFHDVHGRHDEDAHDEIELDSADGSDVFYANFATTPKPYRGRSPTPAILIAHSTKGRVFLVE